MSKIQPIKNVLCPIDFSKNSPVIAKYAAYFAGKIAATLDVVSIVHHFEDYSGFFVPQLNVPNLEKEILNSAADKMHNFIQEYEKEINKAGVTKINHKILLGDISEQILEYAEDSKTDLIIMGTHGYKGLDRIMFGSIADKIVKTAHCPVLTINPYTCCDT